MSKKGPLVYQIRNLLNDWVYIGSTTGRLCNRWSTHRFQLRNGQHGNAGLQAAWDNDGEENFVIEVLEEVVGSETLLDREQYHIDRLRSGDPNRGYNKYRAKREPVVPSPMSTEERARRAGDLHRGKPKTLEQRVKLSRASQRHAKENSKPRKPCRNCEQFSNRPLSKGLCCTCYTYEREHNGEPRPPELFNKPIRRSKVNKQCCNCLAVCVQLARGRCPICYGFFRKHNEDRPKEMWEPLDADSDGILPENRRAA